VTKPANHLLDIAAKRKNEKFLYKQKRGKGTGREQGIAENIRIGWK